MKKLIAFALCALMICGVFAGCGSEDTGKAPAKGLFQYDLSEYMTLSEYKGIKVSPDDDEFVEVVKYQQDTDLENAGYGEVVEITSGKVMMGDSANITYVGTLNGVPFEGGTNTTGKDLIIGSGEFIPGFEEGLIGVSIGSTVDLNLTFPKDYHNADLAGKAVVFTVSVKKVSRFVLPSEITAEIAKKLGFDSVEKYEANLFATAVQTYCQRIIAKNTKVIKLPTATIEYFTDLDMKGYQEDADYYQVSLEQFAMVKFNCTPDELRKQCYDNYSENIANYMSLYYVAQKENLIPTADDVEAEYAKLAEMYSTDTQKVTIDEVKAVIDYEQVEYTIVYDKVRQFLFENADIQK